MLIAEAYKYLAKSLEALYSKREAATMSDWVIEHISGMKKTERLIYKKFGAFQKQGEIARAI